MVAIYQAEVIGKSAFMLWSNAAAYVGPGLDSKLHCHFAGQILVAPWGAFLYRCNQKEKWTQSSVFYVPPGCSQQVIAPKGEVDRVLTIYLDQWDINFIGLCSLVQNGTARPMVLNISTVAINATRHALLLARPVDIRNVVQNMIDRLLQQVTNAKGINPMQVVGLSMQNRLHDAFEYIDANINAPIMVKNLANYVCLSPSRFMAVFSSTLGVSVRKYVLWRRLRLACQQICQSQDRLTDVAIDMGFTDQSHFSNSFSRFFGITPRMIFTGSSKQVYDLTGQQSLKPSEFVRGSNRIWIPV